MKRIRWRLLEKIVKGYDYVGCREASGDALITGVNFNRKDRVHVGLYKKESSPESISLSMSECITLILMCKSVPINEIKAMDIKERLTWIYLFGRSDQGS